jgi:hypothetical protein
MGTKSGETVVEKKQRRSIKKIKGIKGIDRRV